MSALVADRRLYLTADKTRIVEEGNPDGATLFATPGTPIAAEDVARYGLRLVDGQLIVATPEAAEDEAEESAGAENAPAPRSRRR
jgi:hypothetical protein